MKKLTCFKAYDIRGKLGEELNEDIAWRIGRAYGEFLKPKTIVLGGDVRLTSETLKLALAKGFTGCGRRCAGYWHVRHRRDLFRHVPSRRGWRH
ncbi:phosphomannomutase CpsG [Escherichia coli]|nr:phosphomannomutase CpsG [Escherichia coli]